MPSSLFGARALRTAAVCAASAAAVLLAGCVPTSFAPPENSIYGMDVGDCLNAETTTLRITEPTGAECDRPHQGEIYARTGVGHETYPGREKLLRTAVRKCEERFESFIGIGPMVSDYEMKLTYPTEGQWTVLNDRKITCVVFDPAGETTGTLAGVLD